MRSQGTGDRRTGRHHRQLLTARSRETARLLPGLSLGSSGARAATPPPSPPQVVVRCSARPSGCALQFVIFPMTLARFPSARERLSAEESQTCKTVLPACRLGKQEFRPRGERLESHRGPFPSYAGLKPAHIRAISPVRPTRSLASVHRPQIVVLP